VSFGRGAEHARPRRFGQGRLGEQAVALAEQQVADVQGHRNAVTAVERQVAVAVVVAVLDVVVDERGLVEALDRHGDLAQGGRVVAGQRPRRADAQHGAPPLARAEQPVAGDPLRRVPRGPEQLVQPGRGEPALHLAADRLDDGRSRQAVATEAHRLQQPVEVQGGVAAAVAKQRNRHARHADRLDPRENLLERREATGADERLDLPRLDHRRHRARALGDQRDVTESLRLGQQFVDGAAPAPPAEQSQPVEDGGARVGVAQALRKQQQSAVERHGGQRVAPGLVVNEHGRVGHVRFVEPRLGDDGAGVGLQLRQREGRHGRGDGDARAGALCQPVALPARGRDAPLRLALGGGCVRRILRRLGIHSLASPTASIPS